MKSFEEQIKEWEDKGAHFITPIPDMNHIYKHDKPVFKAIYFSSDPKKGDVYKPDWKNNDKFRLSGTAKETIGITANVIWHLDMTGVVSKTEDYVAYRATGGIKESDGQFTYLTSTYDISLPAYLKKLQVQYPVDNTAFSNWKNFSFENGTKPNSKKTIKDFEIYQKGNINRDLSQKRSFMTEQAETNAKNRAVSKLLGLQKEFTKKELECPFVAVRMVLDHNTKDPVLQQMILDQRLQAEFSIYGTGRKEPLRIQEPIPEAELENDIPEEPKITSSTDFENSDSETQLKTIEVMAKNNGYDGLDKYLEKNGCSFLELSAEKRLGLFNHIDNLDDIPF